MSTAPEKPHSAIERHIASLTGIFPHEELLPAYLREFTQQADSVQVDLAMDIVQDGFNRYIEELGPTGRQRLYEDVTLADLDTAVDRGVSEPHVDTVIDGAITCAEDIFDPVSLGEAPEGVYEPNMSGGRFDPEKNEIWVGKEPEQLSFSPTLLGVVGHEYVHRRQLDDKLDEPVYSEESVVYTPQDEAKAHAAFIEIEGLFNPHHQSEYLENIIDRYTESAAIKEVLADDIPATTPYPGGTEDAIEAYNRRAQQLRDAGARITNLPAQNILFSSQNIAPGQPESQYLGASDSAITHRDHPEAAGHSLVHELIHYNQVRSGLGRPSDDFYESLHRLRQQAVTAERELETDELFESHPICLPQDLNLAAAIYAYDGDLSGVYDQAVDSGADRSALEATLLENQDSGMRNTLLSPIIERTQAVDALPLDTHGEVYAMFWSLYERTAQRTDTVSPSDLYDVLHENWESDDRESWWTSLEHYDQHANGASTYIQDGLESAIKQYGERQSEAPSDDVAAASIVQDGLDHFAAIGNHLPEYS